VAELDPVELDIHTRRDILLRQRRARRARFHRRVFSGAAGTATYVYDDSGNRVQETTGGTTSFYLTDTANPTGYAQPIEVWTNTSDTLTGATLDTTYLIGDRIFGQDVTGTLSYLLVDGQDNTRLLTSGSGAVTANYNYDTFGNGLNFSLGTASTDVLFQQTFFDPVSGLNLYGDATRGAEPGEDFYIEMDGQGFGNNSDPITLNLLLLDNADPLSTCDPTGHFGLAALLLGVAIATAVDASVSVVVGVEAAGAINSVLNLESNAINVVLDQDAIAAAGGNLANAAIDMSSYSASSWSQYNRLVAQARKQYPKLAGQSQLHHIIPKYLGGPQNGPLVKLDAAYHRLITTAFNQAWPRGGAEPNSMQLVEIMNKVYSKLPLPPGTT
jgi:hypothetical protein